MPYIPVSLIGVLVVAAVLWVGYQYTPAGRIARYEREERWLIAAVVELENEFDPMSDSVFKLYEKHCQRLRAVRAELAILRRIRTTPRSI